MVTFETLHKDNLNKEYKHNLLSTEDLFSYEF